MVVQTKSFVFEEALLGGRGRQALVVKDALLRHLEEAPANSVTPLDLCRVEFLDFSAADEIIAKVLLRLRSGELGSRYVVLQGVGEAPRESINAALLARDLVCPIRPCDCENAKHEETAQDDKLVLGSLPQPLLETYCLALERGQITARDVADTFGLKISACSNRLTKLQELRLFHRTGEEVIDRGGKQFLYEAVR